MEPQYEDAAQVSLVKDYLPKDVVEDMVGAHVRTIEEVWMQLDARYGDPLSIVDNTCQNIEQVFAKTLGK